MNSHHFPRHFAAKSTSKQAIRTINPTSSTVRDGIGHFLGLRSNIFSPSHTENHSTAGTISNNHHKDISTPGLLWSDRTTKQGQFQSPARPSINSNLHDAKAVISDGPQTPYIEILGRQTRKYSNSDSTGGPARDVGSIAGPVLSDPSVPAIVISEVGGSATPANAAPVISVTSRRAGAAPIRRTA